MPNLPAARNTDITQTYLNVSDFSVPNLPAARNTDMTQTYLMVFGMFFAMLMMWFMRFVSMFAVLKL